MFYFSYHVNHAELFPKRDTSYRVFIGANHAAEFFGLGRKKQQNFGTGRRFTANVFYVCIFCSIQLFLKCLRYTTYEYKLIVHNEVGYTSSEEVIATTLAGLPEKGSILIARAVNHTAVEVEWSKPSKCA